MKKIVAFLFSVAYLAQVYATELIEGYHYINVNPVGGSTQPKVTEFFSYGCPHCFHAEKILTNWYQQKPDDIQVELLPVDFQPGWDVLARLYHTAEVLAVKEKVHLKIFEKLHVDKFKYRRVEDFVDIFVQAGVDKQVFINTAKSSEVSNRLKAAKEKMHQLKIHAVPSFIINNRYKIESPVLSDQKLLIQTLNELPKLHFKKK